MWEANCLFCSHVYVDDASMLSYFSAINCGSGAKKIKKLINNLHTNTKKRDYYHININTAIISININFNIKMFIPKILTLFLSSAVAGAASSDIHSPITLNTDEDVVSSPNLRSLATTERELARTMKAKPFDDDDDGFEIALSLKWTIPKDASTSVGQLKISVLNLLNLALKGYNEDGTQVLGLVSLPDGDGRELVAADVIVYNFGLNLVNKICNRSALTDQILGRETCYCFAAKDIVALLNLYSAELADIAL